MENPDYYYNCSTKIYVINNGIERAGNIIKENGFKKIFLIYGGSSLKKSGNYNKLIASLNSNGIEFIEQGGVLANPDISFVKENLDRVRAYKPDLIFAVGGGSVIDTAKNFCKSFFYDGNPLDFNTHKATPTNSLPLGVLLTLSAAGSEMSNSCVMSDRISNFKGGFSSKLNRPTFSILDPKITNSVNAFQTSCGLVDIISHSFERYFSPSSQYELADYLALSVIKECIDISPILINNPLDEDARRAMMLTSTVSHNGWTSFGKSYRMPCHAVEHTISGFHPEIAHGLGLRFLLAEFMEVNKEELTEKICKFGDFCFDLKSRNPEDTIKKFREYFNTLPLPKTMEEVDITAAEKKDFINRLKLK